MAKFDFQNFLDQQKSDDERKGNILSFADYAFTGDIRVLRTLERISPVRAIAHSSVRAFKAFRKNELLGTSVKVSTKQFPQLNEQVSIAAKKLKIPHPTVYVSQSPYLNAGTYGTKESSFIIVQSGLVDSLTDKQLQFVLGHECGHIQNEHVVYRTASEFLNRGVGAFLKWAVVPASAAISSWSRRAEITCDRAGLLCCGDLDVAMNSMMRLAVGSNKLFENMNIEEFESQVDEIQTGIGRFHELFLSHPYLPKRLRALKLFAQSDYYHAKIHKRGGRPLSEIDEEIEDLISVF